MWKWLYLYGVISVIAFIMICVYNTWSPGNGFSGPITDDFELNLLITWFFLGAVGPVALGIGISIKEELDKKAR